MSGDNDSLKESGRRREVERVASSGTPGFSSAALRVALDKQGVSIEDLADEVGVSHQAVSSWLSGMTTPSPASLLKVARALSLSPADLTPGAMLRPYVGDLRVRSGLTQGAAARALGISTTNMGEIERGRRPVDEGLVPPMTELFAASEQDVINAWENTVADRDRMRADRFASSPRRRRK